MTDPLDLDAMLAAWRAANPEHDGDRHPFGCESCAIERLVAELRTARARIADLEIRYGDTERHWLKERTERIALTARIEAALAICDELEGEIDLACAVRAALSGATEPGDAP